MIFNPQVGMRVRWFDNTGTIIEIDCTVDYIVKLQFDTPFLGAIPSIYAYTQDLHFIEFPSEEQRQDQERRKQHADKYL